MTSFDPRPAAVAEAAPATVQWGAVIAGAIGAAALALVLHSFAAAIGLSISSTAPTWRDASFALVFLSGLYLLLVAIVAYGFGGYVAARMMRPSAAAGGPETDFRDGMHGLLTWALATLITVLMAIAVLPPLTRAAAPSSGPAGPSTSVGSENLIAEDLDRLFRSDRRNEGDIAYARAEAGRILLKTASHNGVPADDRAYLVRLVSARTGLAAADAERRVQEVMARANDNIRRARRSAVVLAFMAGAAALVGAAMAWFAACAGGEHRDGRVTPHLLLRWSEPARQT